MSGLASCALDVSCGERKMAWGACRALVGIAPFPTVLATWFERGLPRLVAKVLSLLSLSRREAHSVSALFLRVTRDSPVAGPEEIKRLSPDQKRGQGSLTEYQ